MRRGLWEIFLVRDPCDMLTSGFPLPSQQRGMPAAPVSRLPWMTSTLTTPLGKWPSGVISLLVSFPSPPPPAQGLYPYLLTYQAVWHLELTQPTDGFGKWNRGVLRGGRSFCRCWGERCVRRGLLLCVIRWAFLSGWGQGSCQRFAAGVTPVVESRGLRPGCGNVQSLGAYVSRGAV